MHPCKSRVHKSGLAIAWCIRKKMICVYLLSHKSSHCETTLYDPGFTRSSDAWRAVPFFLFVILSQTWYHTHLLGEVLNWIQRGAAQYAMMKLIQYCILLFGQQQECLRVAMWISRHHVVYTRHKTFCQAAVSCWSPWFTLILNSAASRKMNVVRSQDVWDPQWATLHDRDQAILDMVTAHFCICLTSVSHICYKTYICSSIFQLYTLLCKQHQACKISLLPYSGVSDCWGAVDPHPNCYQDHLQQVWLSRLFHANHLHCDDTRRKRALARGWASRYDVEVHTAITLP